MSEEKKEEYIYKLTDPFTHEIRWIGRTTDPEARFLAHISIKEEKSEKDGWIIGLRKRNALPIMEIIEKVTSGHPIDRERFWIQEHFAQGAPLFNKVHRKKFTIIGYSKEKQAMHRDLAQVQQLLLRMPKELGTHDRLVFLALCTEYQDELPHRVRLGRIIELTGTCYHTLCDSGGSLQRLHESGLITCERRDKQHTTITVHISRLEAKGKAS